MHFKARYWSSQLQGSGPRIAPITSSAMSLFAHEKSFYSQFRGETLLPDRRGGFYPHSLLVPVCFLPEAFKAH